MTTSVPPSHVPTLISRWRRDGSWKGRKREGFSTTACVLMA